MAAAGRAIVERGVVGLRVRDVADEAGLSPGLVSYYFKNLEDLLLDVHQDAVHRFYWSRMRAVEDIADPRDRLVRLATQGVPSSADDLVCRVLYEVHLHAARSKAHAAMMTALWDREVSLYTATLQYGHDVGTFRLRAPVADVAANAVALEDAYGLHIVGRNSSVPPDRARLLVLRYLEVETGCALATTAREV